MTIPTSLSRAAQRAVQTVSPDLNDPAALRARPKQQLRRYEVSALLPNGEVTDTRHIAPALPLFEDAFCAFSRGTLIDTDMGPVAVEDLLPGDRIITAEDREQTLLWKGSCMIVPGRPGPQGRNMRLTRITADAFGMQRPPAFVVAGHAARLLYTPAHMRGAAKGAQMLTPVQEFVDGLNVIETAPPAAVELFHICLRHHSTIRIGGLDFETYHPGPNAGRALSHQMKSLYFSMFAHAEHFGDFGPLAHPRADEDYSSTILSA
ncbi:MAG: hypothetical protein CML02_07770 [Pseudooceanicola sp.]|jgi:hypothetical protein|nr:hypothetical protein [Pseudooceanicola sp.]